MLFKSTPSSNTAAANGGTGSSSSPQTVVGMRGLQLPTPPMELLKKIIEFKQQQYYEQMRNHGHSSNNVISEGM
jgi:hypothetical protein